MRYCKECDIKYFTADVTACAKCGKELIDGDAVYPKEAKKGFSNKELSYPKIMALSVLAVILLGAAAIFMRSSTANVIAECTEVEEQYFEEVPYEVDGVYAYYPKYSVLSHLLYEQWNNQIGAYYNYTITLQNTDTDDYYYTVQFLLDTSEHGKINSLVKKLVKKGTNENFEAYFDTDLREQVDGRFVVYPEPVQKAGKIIRFENRSLTRTITRC